MALIDSAFDKDGQVKQVITDSLFELGKKQPALVLSSCLYYLKKHSKVNKMPFHHLVSHVGPLCFFKPAAFRRAAGQVQS